MVFKTIIYVLVILIANTLGAISGMGGGVIIKPALQLFRMDPAITINFYSSVAVLVMSISSTCKQVKAHNKINTKSAIWIGLGSIVGGIIGDASFKYVYGFCGDSKSIAIQMILVIITLIMALWASSSKVRTFHLHGNTVMLLTGIVLGLISTFLGIGGGPINTACFMLLFSTTIRDATIYSIITIFFSQISKITQALIMQSVPSLEISIIIAIIFTALFGGWLGATISNKLSQKGIMYMYRGMIVFVLLLDVFNLVKVL